MSGSAEKAIAFTVSYCKRDENNGADKAQGQLFAYFCVST